MRKKTLFWGIIFYFGIIENPFALNQEVSFLPPQKLTIDIAGLLLPNGNNSAHEEFVGFQVPVYKDQFNHFSLLSSASNLELNNPPVLQDGTQLSSNFYKVSVGGQYFKFLEGQRSWGGRISLGSDSDHIFSKIDVTTITVSANYSFPDGLRSRWTFLLFFSNNSQILNYIPLPGFIYSYRTETLAILLGFPIESIRWTPSENWAFYLGLLGPNLTSEISYGPRKSQVFLGYIIEAQSYLLANRSDPKERLFYVENQAKLGGRFQLSEHVTSEISGGYAFNRSVFEAESYLFHAAVGSSPLRSSVFIQGNLKILMD